MKRYKLLISGCGSAGRNVARVAAADGRGEIVGSSIHSRHSWT